MRQRTDRRVSALFEGVKRRHKELVSPEGVPLDIQVAGQSERIVALFIDLAIMYTAIIALFLFFILVLFSGLAEPIGLTLFLFMGFVIRNFYFMHFELAWQGRTPGKKAVNLRVINRSGGELTPSAIIARNLTREVEIFLPLSLIFTLNPDGTAWRQLAILGWVVVIAGLSFFNKDRLRAGDIIAGTQVIAMPKRKLLSDLTSGPQKEAAREFVFTHEQLSSYGAYELQVLEELLRRSETMETRQLLEDVAKKICARINWPHPLPTGRTRAFLTDFYTAERAELERGQLFGRHKADKTDTGQKKQPGQ